MSGCRIGRVTLRVPDNVVMLDGATTLDLPPARVLAGALEANLDAVLVLGLDRNGGEYFAGSTSDSGLALCLVERFKYLLMREVDAA
jgi:hypothetical protein